MKSREEHVAASSNYYNYTSSNNARQALLCLKCTGNFVYEPGYDLYRSSFDSYLLEVVLEGRMIFETQGEQLEASKGQVVLLDCYKPHRYYSHTGCTTLWVHFDGIGAEGYYDWIHRVNGTVFHTRSLNQVQRSLNAIYEMFHRERIPNEPQIALELTSALTALMERTEAAKSIQKTSKALDEVLYYINENIQNSITVGELAKIANFSEYHFIRRFRDAVGMTPRKYIITVRMEHAKYLLKNTTLPVQEVGYACGYVSDSMFCTVFKEHLGVTPTAYRNGCPV